MNVLSLFDGMACGRIALERANVQVDNYFASEIDKHAMEIAKKNWPDIKHIGNITQVKASDLPQIDLLIGGSPCQGFSFAGKQLNFDDPRSKLFFEYVRLLKECKPKYFLLENVKMKKEYQTVISEALGCEPILINSALVSAQNRKRLYWTNITEIKQPDDKGILLKDILEDGINQVYQRSRGNNPGGLRTGKSPSMGASAWEQNVKIPIIKNHDELIIAGRLIGRAKVNGKRIDHKGSVAGKTIQEIEINQNPQKTNCLSTVQKDNLICKIKKNKAELLLKMSRENPRIKELSITDRGIRPHKNDSRKSGISEIGTIHYPDTKSYTITAAHAPNVLTDVLTDIIDWRKLTPIECERLQTVPDRYTEGVSTTQRYKMLGNGWTVDVISHIFKGITEKQK